MTPDMRRTLLASFAAGVATVGLIAGCGSIPAYVPDLAPGTPVAVDSAHGPLSPARSQAVVARLRDQAPASDVLGRHLAIEQEITGAPLSAGNRVTLLENGPATYQAMFDAIASARSTIDMETYILEDDEVGHRFVDALVERQRAGVQVNLIHDSVGTIKTPATFFTPLTDAGIHVVEFNPVNPLHAKKGWELNQRDHRKLMVVDGRVAILGGINISAVYSSRGSSGSGGSGGGSSHGRKPPDGDGTASSRDAGWRDTDVRIEGPAAAEFQRLFLETWKSQKGPELGDQGYFPEHPESPGHSVVRAVGSAPDEPYAIMFSALLSAINSAESTVHLTNAYFVPDPQLLQALEAAAQRGVDVSLVLPGHTDSWLVYQAGHHYYEPLLEAGVKIHERRGPVLHAKTAVIDGVWSTVGSTNLDWRSFHHNQEIDAIVLGPEFAGELEALFQSDLAGSEPITLAAWHRRGAGPRVEEMFARAWAYWL
jgi:cardiolipin synthase